ncbi:unnamed protein product [Pneumocystis jirovecii]|uniref:RRM domain-containing protein n=1 Tax=Pneumocystis jirovecii TaxID=42068 RepID=L0P8Y7_PNEJI|nr:unnamed protein product [Pneumocystis jirovecii]
MWSNTVNIKNISTDLSEEEVIMFFSPCGRILGTKLNRQEDGTQEMRIKFDSRKAKASALLLDGTELKGSKLSVEENGLRNIEGYIGILMFYIVITLNCVRTYISQHSVRLTKYLSYGYVFADKLLQKGIELDRKYKISERLYLIMQVALKKVKAINNRYAIDQKIKKIDSKYNILNTVQGKIYAIARYFQLIMNTKTGNKIHIFFTKCCRKCRGIHEEALRLANLKQTKIKQT